MSGEALADLSSWLDPPLVVVTTAANNENAGCVVGFHTQCSIDPVRYALWISKANHTCRVALFASHFAVHFLDRTDHDLAVRFGASTGDEIDKFAGIEWAPGPGDVPLLRGCERRIVLQRVSVYDDGSDHVCFVGTPVDVTTSTRVRAPLRMSDADDIDAGHPADDPPLDSADVEQ